MYIYTPYPENLLAQQWRAADEPGQEVPTRVFYISPNSVTFNPYYNGVQDAMKAMAGMDDLLEGTCICANEECICK